jgi:cytoskeletal protein RodZ
MATLGEELKAARESKGLTLRQIAESTRISMSFLAALEADDYSSIPGEVFVTGFLRSYARELGIPEKEILAKYRQLNPPPAEPSYSQVKTQQKTQHKPKPSLMRIPHGLVVRKMPLPALILAGLILGGIFTALAIMLTSNKAPERAVITEVPVQATPPEPFVPATTDNANAFNAGTSTKPAIPPVEENITPQAAPQIKPSVVVKLTATEKSWYSYSADNGQRKRGIIDKGTSLSIVADDMIILDLGNAGGVRVEYNGKELKSYGRQGVPVINIVFSKDIPGEVQSHKARPEPKKIDRVH